MIRDHLRMVEILYTPSAAAHLALENLVGIQLVLGNAADTRLLVVRDARLDALNAAKVLESWFPPFRDERRVGVLLLNAKLVHLL